MLEIILSFVVFVVVVLGMSIGIKFGRNTLQGSCGGLNQIPGIESDCNGQCKRPCAKKNKPGGC
ncbi:hypothetical protein MNBD_GAMMA09-3454 [hydrothermal vent metagenome]|uniref:Exported or periplasmic protein in ApbE locus n=1 Tax=hydrothermal vent metagenome TaxID=652676 RepID=A0A3B0XW66_9ZZZZ